MRCKKYCKCSECEMARMDTLLVIDDRKPFFEQRYAIPMGKCGATGNMGETTTQIKSGRFTDDILFVSENEKEALQLINDFKDGFVINTII